MVDSAVLIADETARANRRAEVLLPAVGAPIVVVKVVVRDASAASTAVVGSFAAGKPRLAMAVCRAVCRSVTAVPRLKAVPPAIEARSAVLIARLKAEYAVRTAWL